MALDRLEVGGATTGGIKVSGFFLKRGMFGGGMMVVSLVKCPTEQPCRVTSVSSHGNR